MAVKLPGKGRDERVEQILADPKAYFTRAREKARAEIEAEKRARRPRLRHRPA
ncbi:hypothetical protein GCM10011519_20540 [Marmoricola endophyticus]|uniref:Uncharacterized protein n=1 Tax=Marmoricola endophyticus TaxID=2040280 RepID=A0A917F414_9ACTN|nr:hypothetical protein [Marmoricola endophyticus]GGF46465.1 hypothetical protein GCM10011519_20540 [Marmoricola endophyticus]